MSLDARAGAVEAFLGPSQRRRGAGIAGFARARPLGAACGVVLLAVLIVAILAHQLAPYSANVNDLHARLRSPSAAHLLGTDNFGRDVLSRIFIGARISLQVAGLATAFSVALSLLVGVTAASYGGGWDYLVGRLVDTVQALPGIILLIMMLALFGRGITSIGVVLGVLSGLIGSRIVRGAALSVAAQAYVDVARATGAHPLRIMVRHIVPNVLPIVIVGATITVGAAVIAEASLSFIGYGVPPPNPSWGSMLSTDGRAYMSSAPWLFFAPAVALALVVFCVNMFGDALRDVLDPRLRGAR